MLKRILPQKAEDDEDVQLHKMKFNNVFKYHSYASFVSCNKNVTT